ncbi:site-2 protease family protein [Granulicella cerasi]|uniref:Site-2 protease family protein n=1 Tax=Granulicella cerasi TaxID=741063 RepID=A0ABW1ZAC2_9BACT|nr:site-2 protease family protein [Granulicella cerasi]
MPLNVALIIFELVLMVLAICIHDCAQAWAANKLGDPTARMLGRMTMNPAAHFDLFGMVIWPLLYIWRSPMVLGWGKPVPMTWRNFSKKNGEMLATLAGPAAQLGTAIVCLIVLVILKHTVAGAADSLVDALVLTMRAPVDTTALPGVFPVLLLLDIAIFVNLLLAIFNLVPIPFLDGGKILVHFLPYDAAKAFEQYGLYIMIAFFFFGFTIIMAVFSPVFTIFQRLLLSL